MADFILDHLHIAVRIAFGFVAALSVAFGIQSVFADDVHPTWFCSGLYLIGAVLYLHAAIVVRPTRTLSWGLAFFMGASLFRGAALIIAPNPLIDGPHLVMTITAWVAVAGLGAIATLGAAQHLGTRRVRRGR